MNPGVGFALVNSVFFAWKNGGVLLYPRGGEVGEGGVGGGPVALCFAANSPSASLLEGLSVVLSAAGGCCRLWSSGRS